MAHYRLYSAEQRDSGVEPLREGHGLGPCSPGEKQKSQQSPDPSDPPIPSSVGQGDQRKVWRIPLPHRTSEAPLPAPLPTLQESRRAPQLSSCTVGPPASPSLSLYSNTPDLRRGAGTCRHRPLSTGPLSREGAVREP